MPRWVLPEFGADGNAELPEALAGGLGRAFRVGQVVLRPVSDGFEAVFIAEVMSRVEVDAECVRVARPVRSAEGSWVVGGWAAWEFHDGFHLEGAHPWNVALRAIEALNDGLAKTGLEAAVPPNRHHPWAVADRVAWDEVSVEVHPRIAELVEGMKEIAPPVDGPSQLIHGDVSGNLLFDEVLPPVVIDFSPFHRPAGHAAAIYAVDAVAEYGGDLDLLRHVAVDPIARACLPRAVVFRLVAADLWRREAGVDIRPDLPTFERVSELVHEAIVSTS